MRRVGVHLALALLGIFVAEASVQTLQPLSSAAGPDARTVLIYDTEALPFSLLNVRRLVERLISRVDTRITAHELAAVPDTALAEADYVVLLGVTGWTDSARIRAMATQQGKPVLAIGGAIATVAPAAVGPLTPSSSRAAFVRSAILTRGPARFTSDLSAIFPVAGRKPTGGEVLAEAEWQGRRHVLAGRVGNVFWFSALPLETATGFVFSDVILDFFGVKSVGPSGILCLLEGVPTDGSAGALKRAADLLASRNHPFAMSVQMPGPAEDARAVHAFSLDLQYAQARGGRIFLTLPGNPFWNGEADRPADTAALAGATAQCVAAFEWAVKNAIFPFGVRLPDSGFSESAATVLFPTFAVALGIAQASDASASATFAPSSLTGLPSGGRVLPMSLWFRGPEPASSDIDTARNLLRLRGTVLGVSIPAWQTFQQTEKFLQTLFALEVPFLDPVDGPVVISTVRGLLMTSAAPPVAPLFTGNTRIRTYDRGAREFSNDSRTLPRDSPPLTCPEGAGWLLATPES